MLPTAAQIQALASDAGSLKRARGTAKRGKWQNLGRSDLAVWGECKGSATYRVKTELSTLTLTCSCPSRVRPCKHSLAMMLLAADDVAAFAVTSEPDWVVDWLKGRQDRRAAKEAKAAAPKTPVDAAAAAKRVAQHEARVVQGLAAHRRWLEDILLDGLGALEVKPFSFWEGQAARMADAQAPGLRRWLLRVGDQVGVGEDWPLKVLDELGRMALLMEAYGRQDSLPPALVHDVRRTVGWTVSKASVLEDGEHISDRWLVFSQVIRQEDDRLHSRTTRLLGLDSRRHALVVEYAPMVPRFELALPLGQVLSAELAYYPSAAPDRAHVVSTAAVNSLSERPPGGSVTELLDGAAEVLALHPWRRAVPGVLHDVRLVTEPWAVVDAEGFSLPLAGEPWGLLAASAGEPMDVLGSWEGRFTLRAAWTGTELVHL